MRERISRRIFMQYGMAGLGAAVSLRVVGKEGLARMLTTSRQRGPATQPQPQGDITVDAAAGEPDRAATTRDLALAALVAPIAVGTRLGSTNVASIRVDKRHLGVVTVTDEHGRNWDVEVARRTNDDAALNPLAISTYFSLYLRNGGTGRTPTNEGVGRAVLAIASTVERNEDAAPALRLASRAEVWASTGYRQNA